MSQHLHLRAFTGRPAAIGEHLAAHAINPASQAVLSRIPALTLVESYARGPDYAYAAAFRRAAQEVLGGAFAERLEADLLLLEDVGLDKLGERRARLRERYAAIDHQAAREVVAWLDEAYAVTGEVLQTQ
jgi:hypothetical protein